METKPAPEMPWGLVGGLLLLLGGALLFTLGLLRESATPLPPGVLHPRRALVGEEVRFGIGDISPERVRVTVDGVEAPVVERRPGEVRFRVPQVPGGKRRVVARGSPAVEAELVVLGRVVREEALLFLPEEKPLRLPPGFQVVEEQRLGECGLRLYRLRVEGLPLGLALEALEAQDPAYKADPESLWSLDQEGAGIAGARGFWARGVRGGGVTVAVLDTGVEPFPGGRFLPGYDFVEGDPLPQDGFPGGHGTQVASLVLEVAPEARILPLRVCDERGVCRASRVVQGVCYALAGPRPLVLNLSLGGETPVEVLEAVLRRALAEGVGVVAAGGNQGPQGPAHYPAALDLPGLLAVGALDARLEGPAPFSTWGAYLDLLAPGEGVACRGPGGVGAVCRGSSFAAPWVAGALALLMEERPGMDPKGYEDLLKAWARPLPYPPEAVGAGALRLP
ncbi:hypothetical protein TJA_15110 [Thermus sp. LT1-2-5]|uniref:S8 family peptidase n=1 Tax=Thermus sp. LT1-2-5 TaxID=3026935 RepID=UPI0030EAFFEA